MKLQSLLAGLILCAVAANAQLIPSGKPVPRTSKLPVVFVNGFEPNCSAASFAGTFGIADQVLQANGEVSLFFNYCDVSGAATIEDLGNAFAGFLADLRYEDGQPVPVVDVVVHSMGGLIVRCYLSGKLPASGAFNPPVLTHIRKIVFFGTPHFGTGIAMGFAFTSQLQELSSGSRFLFDLATWNQGTDDLRGVDAVTVIGNGGTGLATTAGFDDGVVALTSASLGFYMPGRTRVVPLCHVDGGGLLSFFGFCAPTGLGVARVHSPAEDPARIMVSFLNGTNDWRSIGVAAEQNPFLAADGGLYVAVRSASDAALQPDSVIAGIFGSTKSLNIPSHDVAYTDMFPAGPLTLTARAGPVQVSGSFTLPAGTVDPIVLKPGPSIARVLPSASGVFPLSAAPGMIVAIYGASLAAQTATAPAPSLPLQLSDAQVLVGGSAIPLYYAAPDLINAVIPASASGLVKLMVRNASGSHTVNVWIEPAVPAIYTQDGSGKGAAAALNALSGVLVTPRNPLHAGDYLELFLTGLGSTTTINGLDVANQRPAVTIAGKDCAVTYAGRNPVYPGLDQINCVVPAGLAPDSAAAVTVTSGMRSSNAATVAVQ